MESTSLGPVRIAPLTSSEYAILGNVTGVATAESYLGIFGAFENCNIPLICAPNPEKTAYYNAVQSVPEADALIAPRSKTESFTIPLIYSKKTVTITGKAIQLKPHK